MADERVERARLLYERAVFAGDLDAPLIADRELNAVEADLALTRGQVMHARFLQDREEFQNELPSFERALNLYRSLGDERGQAEALFWIGCSTRWSGTTTTQLYRCCPSLAISQRRSATS